MTAERGGETGAAPQGEQRMDEDEGVDHPGEGDVDDAALTVGDAVHRLRRARGWSLQRLAVAAHISKQHLWNIERGAARPDEVTIKNLARALETPAADLMGEPSGNGERPISPALRAFAERYHLGAAQVEALAAFNYRGRAPRTVEDWALLWRVVGALLDGDEAGHAEDAP